MLLPPGRKLDQEKARLDEELRENEEALILAKEQMLLKQAKDLRLRKIRRQLDSRDKEMFHRELLSIEELERLENSVGVGAAVAPAGALPPQSLTPMSPDWNQLAADWGFSGKSSQTLLPSAGSSSNVQ